jgi:8-oxo-dGTP diphosphatase
VAAAVLTNPRAEVLLCQRPPGGRFGLKWEFPGGKVEPGETARGALVRELREELGIDSRPGTLLLRLEHRYDGGPHVLLDFFQVRTYHGTPRNLAFHDIRWVEVRELPGFDLLEADLPLICLLAQRECP